MSDSALRTRDLLEMDHGQSSRKEIEKRKEEERLIKLRSELVNTVLFGGSEPWEGRVESFIPF